MAAQLEIESADVIKLLLQFCKENNLTETWKTLSTETKVCMNIVDNLDLFVLDIQNGKWDSVLVQLNTMSLPKEKLEFIYEQIIFEMLELGERELAREILREAEPFKLMKSSHAERYLKLEYLCKRALLNPSDLYEGGGNKESRRQEIVNILLPEISVVPPARLLTILSHGLKYQQAQGMLPKSGKLDLFKGIRRTANRDIEEKYVKRMGGVIRFDAASHPESTVFANDGQSLITCSIDGFIEVWDPDSCKIRMDLEYQAHDEFMSHSGEAVLCAAMSKDGELLATGSQTGAIKVWNLQSGACVRRFDQAHPQGVTSVCFSKDCSQLLSTSFDTTARLHGLKSGKTLKEFRGHSSYVNCGIFTKDHLSIMTGSSDGTVKIWDSKTSECLNTFRPGFVSGGFASELTVHTLIMLPDGTSDHIFVCGKSSSAYLINLQGRVLRTYSTGKTEGGDILCATVSPQGTWVYCVAEDGLMYVFDTVTCQLEHTVNVCLDSDNKTSAKMVTDATGASSNGGSGQSRREVIGVAHHPHRNLVVTITDDGQLKLWVV